MEETTRRSFTTNPNPEPKMSEPPMTASEIEFKKLRELRKLRELQERRELRLQKQQDQAREDRRRQEERERHLKSDDGSGFEKRRREQYESQEKHDRNQYEQQDQARDRRRQEEHRKSDDGSGKRRREQYQHDGYQYGHDHCDQYEYRERQRRARQLERESNSEKTKLRERSIQIAKDVGCCVHACIGKPLILAGLMYYQRDFLNCDYEKFALRYYCGVCRSLCFMQITKLYLEETSGKLIIHFREIFVLPREELILDCTRYRISSDLIEQAYAVLNHRFPPTEKTATQAERSSSSQPSQDCFEIDLNELENELSADI